MNEFNFLVADATATLVIAFMAGWMIGGILWILRYLIMELPKTGKLSKKGGEKL